MACENTITSISVTAGATGTHVTVLNAMDCSDIPPANLTVTLDAALTGIVTVTQDATGFIFTVPNINQAALVGGALFTNTANGVNANLVVEIAAGGVTGLEFTSP